MAARSSFLFIPQFRGELTKLFARPRTYIGFGAFVFIEVLILLLMLIPKVQFGLRHQIENQGYLPDLYFSGLTLAVIVVSATIILIAPLFLALIAGDVVSKEVEDGTMRLILSRPVARFRVLLVRYLAAILYTLIFVIFIAVSALLIGLARQGIGGLFVIYPGEKILAIYEFWPGLQRLLISIPLMALSYMTVTSLGFLFSCCNMKPASATIVCLALYLIDVVFQGFPQFASIREYFLSTHISTWKNVYQPIVPVWAMVEDYAYLLGANVTFFVLGALIFQGRDFKA